MELIQQTKFGDPDGNCLEACIASLTGIDLEDIPHFLSVDWFADYRLWLFERGWHFVHFLVSEIAAPLGLVIASGPGPRGMGHSVLYRDGKLAYDPHPEGTGLAEVQYWLIVDMTEAAIASQATEVTALTARLKGVERDLYQRGRVWCADFERCMHRDCRSSREAWMIAARALGKSA